MPRTKRPLAEADPNASRAHEDAKRAKPVPSKNTNITADGYESKGKDELVAILRERKLPHKGTKKILIQRLEENGKVEALNERNTATLRSENTSQTLPRRQSNRPPNSDCSAGLEMAEVAQVEKAEEVRRRSGRTEDGNRGNAIKKATTNYSTKDNGKLRTLLFDRGLSTAGTPKEMIARLENSPVDYEKFTSAEISEMLKRRHVKMCEQGSKEMKIQRLKLNDELDRDTGNSDEAVLYGRLSAMEDWVFEPDVQQLENIDKRYSHLSGERLIDLLKERNLSRSGDRSILLERLRDNDRKTLPKRIEKARQEYISLKAKLESRIGHPVHASENMEAEGESRRLDTEIQMNYRPTRAPGFICDYNWKYSHWASRTERELIEICTRREMPGHGPKTAMLKWLDTGEVEFEELYTSSVESMCRKRGLRVRSGEKKVELIRILREANEPGVEMEHSST
jgi:hypothetical protein